MDFFAHQEAARKRTALLLFYYAIAVMLLVLATYIAAMLVFFWQGDVSGGGKLPLWHPQIFAGATLGTLAVIGLGAAWRMIELRQGGAAVAQMLGGTLLSAGRTDEHEQQLRNVIEEMAIASGTPVPEIYVLQDERGINAFAAGHTINDAAIGVTRGCVQRLNRDELQGVIAHEFSHILNGDMRMNIRLMGVLHGILCVYIIGRVLLHVRSSSSGSRKKGGNPLPLFGLLLMLIGGLGILFSRLIQAAISRQREFLADASAVQFTRNPNGIAGALKKIGGTVEGSRLEAPEARSASHFFFGNGISESWFNFMATHPPLSERIKRIDPNFDGRFPEIAQDDRPTRAEQLAVPMDSAAFTQLSDAPRVAAGKVTRRVGETIHVQYAADLINSLPAELRAATGNSWSSVAIMFALVLSRDAEIRSRQLAQLSALDSNLAAQSVHHADALATQDARARLLLLNLSLPALRTISREQWQRLRAALEQMVCCDAQIDLFEFVLRRVIERNIDAHFAPQKASVIQFYSFTPLARDCAVLLSALAYVGNADANEMQRAFIEGAGRLPIEETFPLVPASDCGVQQIDAALSRLAQSVPHIKKTVLEACAHAAACDGFVKAEEAELLRAIAESLGCPIPPFIAGV